MEQFRFYVFLTIFFKFSILHTHLPRTHTHTHTRTHAHTIYFDIWGPLRHAGRLYAATGAAKLRARLTLTALFLVRAFRAPWSSVMKTPLLTRAWHRATLGTLIANIPATFLAPHTTVL